MHTSLALGCVVLAACVSPDAIEERSQAAIYGADDRTEYYASSPLHQGLTRESVVALVDPFDVDTSDPSDVRLFADDLAASEGVCAGERFADQPTAAFCSGTLIDDDLVLTAGHCFDDGDPDGDCEATRFVFNYFYAAVDEPEVIREAEDVYGCARVLVRRNDDLPGGGALDYAVVQLDRAVGGSHAPAPVVRTPSALGNRARLTMIGFPSGIPAKVDEGGTVYDSRRSALDFFVSSNDSFTGSSGSGVFDDTGTVVGILFAGDDDWELRGGCFVPNVLPESEGGSWSTYAGVAIEDLCGSGFPTRLCSATPDAGSDADAGGTDTGPSVDAGELADGAVLDGARLDGGADAGDDGEGGGCGCRAVSGDAGLSIALILIVLWRRR